MGIYDRKYMKDPDGVQVARPARRRVSRSGEGLTWWQRFRFKLWLVLHRRDEDGKAWK